MKSFDGKKYIYEKNQLVEVICQLRFPDILSIETDIPAAYQERIRDKFPHYQTQEEKVTLHQGVQTRKNHAFISAEGAYKLTLSQNYIALSTLRYTSWDDFAAHFDQPLGEFISLYKPADFERVGLRYTNGIYRDRLGLEDLRWSDLIQSRYLSVLDSDDVDEQSIAKCTIEVEMQLDEYCHLDLHAGPGLIKRGMQTPQGMRQVQEKGVCFIFDQDIFVIGPVKMQDAVSRLELLHEHADRLFSEAITDTLHNAMEPVIVE